MDEQSAGAGKLFRCHILQADTWNDGSKAIVLCMLQTCTARELHIPQEIP